MHDHYVDADEYDDVVVPMVTAVLAGRHGIGIYETDRLAVWKYARNHFNAHRQVGRGLTGQALRRKSAAPGSRLTLTDRLLSTRPTAADRPRSVYMYASTPTT